MNFTKIISKLAYPLVIGCSLVHILCCGIPLVLSLTNLVTILNLTNNTIFRVTWFELVETQIMVASGLFLAASIIIQIYSKYLKCCDDKEVTRKLCKPRRDMGNLFLIVASSLYCFNLITIFFEGI